MERMYCTECHGRGYDQHDELCHHCGGDRYEPDRFQVDDEMEILIAELELEPVN